MLAFWHGLTLRLQAFLRANMWIVVTVGIIVVAQLFFDIAMSCQLCCGGSSLIRGYEGPFMPGLFYLEILTPKRARSRCCRSHVLADD